MRSAAALHPFTKLTIAACAVVIAFAAGFLGAIGVLALLLLLSLRQQVTGTLLRRLWLAIGPIGLFLLPIHGFFHPGATPLFTVVGLTFTQEGLNYAGLILSRLAVLATALLLFALTTSPSELAAALTQQGLPPTLTYLLISPFQLLPEIRVQASTILAAQQARGLETTGTLWQRSRALLPLVVPLVLGALVAVEERAMALEARAFRAKGRKTSLLQLPDSRTQRYLRYGLLAATGLVIGWRYLSQG